MYLTLHSFCVCVCACIYTQKINFSMTYGNYITLSASGTGFTADNAPGSSRYRTRQPDVLQEQNHT